MRSAFFSAAMRSGIFNAYTLPVEGGAPEPLTRPRSTALFRSASFRAMIEFFLPGTGRRRKFSSFLLDSGWHGNGLDSGGKAQGPVHGVARRMGAFFLFPATSVIQDSSICIAMTRRPMPGHLLYRNEQGLDLGPISRDERWIALNRANTTSDSDIYLFDIVKQEVKHLTPHEGAIASVPRLSIPLPESCSFSPMRGANSSVYVPMTWSAAWSWITKAPNGM